MASFLKGGSEDTLSVLERFWLVPTSKGMRGDTGSGTTISAIPLRGGGALLLVVDKAGGKYFLGRVISLVLDYTVALGH